MSADPWNRRGLLLTALAAGLGLPGTPPAAAEGAPSDGALNLTSPEDNLRAYVKLRGSLVAQTVLKWSRGTLFCLIPGQTPRPLLGYQTLVRAFWEPAPAGFQYRYYNLGFFSDLDTGAAVDVFENPYTGRKVRPMTLRDGPAGAVYTSRGLQMPGQSFAELADRPPFILPWVVSGDDIWVSFGFGGERDSPLTPDEWPLASTGERLHSYTQVTYQGRVSELQDSAVNSVAYRFISLGITSWLPWLLMGQRPGFLLWHSMGRKISSLDETSPVLRAFLAARFPDFLTSSAPWASNEDVWTRYPRERPRD